jgi:prepilin-type N-terminal cleavage/methylation domain-containing protein
LAFRRAIEPGGFSLLELVIVLVILGLIGTFALPPMIRLTERTRFSLARQDVERQLDQLPQTAATQGRNLVLSSMPEADIGVPVPVAAGKDPYPVTVPEGWRITVDAPIIYRYDGSCSGGKLHLTAFDVAVDYRMNPPLCELRPG